MLILKATIPGGALGNLLFDVPVHVDGYTTKDGTYVAPTTSIRHKRVTAPAASKPAPAASLDLFSAPVAAALPAVTAPPPLTAKEIAEKRAHGARVAKEYGNPVTPYQWSEAESAAFRAGYDEVAHPEPAEVTPPDPVGPAHKPRVSRVRAPKPPAVWGVQAGVTKGQRVALNASAVAILDSKADDAMTAADRATLARYSGTGGCGDSINEFYTDPAVASAMWALMGRAGFNGGDVLEPSSGIGVFLHTAPAGARVTAVEMDPISARIAGILHRPAGHEVHNSSLERFATQDGRTFDAVIGNVPFGLRGETIRDDKRSIAKADQYFVDTALDKAKDGGLVALIVPTGIMDSSSGRAFRERLMGKGEFLGAYRMPNTAFEASHTEVTSDIVLFRKRPQDVAGALGVLDQDGRKAVGVWDDDLLAGTYFTTGRGKPNVFGSLEPGWRAKAGMGDDITVEGSMLGVPDGIAMANIETPHAGPTVPAILDALGDDEAAKQRVVSAALKPPYQVAKPGDIRVIDGVSYVLQGDPLRWHKANEELPAAVRDAQRVADYLDEVAEGRGHRMARIALTEALDSYVANYGIPSKNKELARWLGSPSLANEDGAHAEDHSARVQSAQRRVARLLGAVGEDGAYSDLVTGETRVTEAADFDVVAMKLSLEGEGFTPDQLARATGRSASDVLEHLFASPIYAVEAGGKTWTTLDSYVSGDLWTKFDAAKAATEEEGIGPDYRAKYLTQAAILEEAIDPQSLEDVEIMLNSGFITTEDINAWTAAKNADWKTEHPGTQYAGPSDWTLSYEDGLYTAHGGYGSGHLIEKYLNRAGVKKDERDDVDKLNADFATWVRGSAIRQRVEDRYNRTYRGFRAPAYSDAAIPIPGLNPALDVNAYHFSGIRWALEAGKGIIAADVGLGKTGRGLMLAKLAKATGQAKKPTFVVPKSVLANWLESAEFWFPGSKVLTIGETYTKNKAGEITSKSDDAATRRRKYHEMQQNDYDFVFISQPAWNDLDVDPITKGEYVNQDFWTKRGDAMGNKGTEKLHKIRTAYEQAMASREFAVKEDTIYFGDLGVDMLLLDEGHAFKNLYSAKNRFGLSPKFLGGSGESNRAQDTFFKTKQLRDANGGKGVFMLTATPTRNSPLEVYSMLAHIAPESFERMGIKNSEEFLDRFCTFEEDTILNVSGGIEEALITSGFKNLDELREVMRRYIDRKTAEDVGLVIPKADPRVHYVDMTAEQEAVYHVLREAAAAPKKKDASGDSHIFSIMSKMGKASVDLAMIDASHAGAVSPKLDKCADTAVANSAEGGQIIFCDHVEMHDKIAAALVARGIPRNQIGIINADVAKSGAARQSISDKFNRGQLRFVIGNTPTMGEGVNLQIGTADIHHLDLPWEPSSMQQRNGRGVRQGNKKGSVRVHTYLAKGSFDGYRYQTIAAKKDWQDLLWNGGDKVDNLAREGGFSRSDMLIMLAADPDAARTKYEGDKAAALERKTAEERTAAVADFVKLQEMTASHVKLTAGGHENAATRRLAIGMTKLRTRLDRSKSFAHKDLLTSTQPALIEPNTGFAWTKNKAFTLAGGSGGPIHYSDVDSRWVVTDVDTADNTVTARPYGTLGARSIILSLPRMKTGVTPFEFSPEAEAAALDAEAANLKVSIGAKANARLSGGKGMQLHELRDLPAETMKHREAHIQQMMKDTVNAYGDAHRNVYGLIDPDGSPVVVPSYEARANFVDHDLLLPTPDHRAKAIDGFVQEGLKRQVRTRYQEARRHSYGNRTATGIHAVYGKFEHVSGVSGNPWHEVLRDVFGPEAAAEGPKALHAAVLKGIDKAPNLRDAIRFATAAVDMSGAVWGGRQYGASTTAKASPWPPEVVRALAAKARLLGVMDQRLQTVAPTSSSSYNGDIHPDMYTHNGTNYATDDYDRKERTVRHWLEAIAHPDDAAGIKS